MSLLLVRSARYPLFLACLVLPLTTGCNFDVSGIGAASDASPNPTDGQPNPTDGQPNPTDGPPIPNDGADPLCGWAYDPVHFDPCTNVPPNPPTLNLNMSGRYVYDTDAGTLTAPDDSAEPHISSTVNGIRMVWASDVTIGGNAELRAIGNMPLLIASTSNIDVQGDINVASFWDQGAYDVGADSDPVMCVDATVGESCNHGGGGGGGGGFGAAGGPGGTGGDDRDCGGGQPSEGGMGGAMAVNPNNLRGGCDGKNGGAGDGGNTFGIGGPGGGAIHLTAAQTLTIAGVVHAGGAGGRGSVDSRAAGGGGGSGGMIGLEAIMLVYENTAVLAANGGGGGGGSGDNLAGMPGRDGQTDGTQAGGGAGEPTRGGNGGAGGWVTDPGGGNGQNGPDRGGGGGGGGVGYIVIYNATTSGNPAVVSPATVTVP